MTNNIIQWMPQNNLTNWTNNLLNRQNSIRTKIENEQSAQRDLDWDKLFECSLTSTDPKVIKKYTSASNLESLWWSVRQWFQQKTWKKINWNVSAWDLVCRYLNLYPDKEKAVNSFLDWKTDLRKAQIDMWLQEDDTKQYSYFAVPWSTSEYIAQNVLWAVADNVAWIPKSIVDIWWWASEKLWWDREWADNIINKIDERTDVWQERDSEWINLYNTIWWVADIAELFIPVLWQEKAAALVWKMANKSPKLAKLVQQSPKLSKYLEKWTEWLVKANMDTVQYWLQNDEMPTWTDFAIASVAWPTFSTAWQALSEWKNLAKSLWQKAIQEWWPLSATNAIRTMNKLTKWDRIEYANKFKEDYWITLNNMWIVDWTEGTINKLNEFMTKNKDKVDEWLAAIEWTFKNKNLNEMADDVAAFAEEVSINPEEIAKYRNLATKAKSEWLTMSEINDVKRYYERNNKFTYGRDTTQWAAKKSLRATNLDNAVRERQIEEAAKRWFDNLREMNIDTAKSKWLIDNLWKELKWTYWNTAFDLSDYLIVAWLSANNIAALWGKKLIKSDWFLKKYAEIVNKINKHNTVEEKLADLESISKINNEKDLEKWLESDYNTPKLEYNPSSNVRNLSDVNTYITEWDTIVAKPSWDNFRVKEWTVLDRN